MRRWEIYLDIIMELAVISAGAFLLVFVLPGFVGFLWPFVGAWIVAMIAHPLIDFLEKKLKLPKRFGSALLMIFVIAALVVLMYVAFSNLGHQLVAFGKDFPQIKEATLDQLAGVRAKLGQFLSVLPNGAQKQMQTMMGSMDKVINSAMKDIGNYGVSHAGGLAKSMTNGFIGVVVMFFAAYLFLADKEKLTRGYEQIVPEMIKHKVDIFVHNTLGVIGSYCWAQFKIMFIMMAILWVGLLVAGVSYAFLFALIIALFDVLPVIGTGTILIPWALYRIITGDVKTAVIFLIAYVICLITKQVLQPKMMGDQMGISALSSLFLIYVGFKWNGLIGMLVVLVLGLFLLNLYRLGVFDRKIMFFRRRIEMLILNSEEEEQQMEEENHKKCQIEKEDNS